MRKSILLAVLLALGATGVAFAATVHNNYVISSSTKVKPVKSGTKKKPKPAGATINYTVSTTPSGERPNVVETIALRVQGASEDTTKFPACSTSRLLDPSEGPTTCPSGSLAGTGFFIAEIGPTNNQSSVLLTCRADVSVYNGGNHDLSFYLYKGTESNACPLPQNYAIDAPLTKSKKGLTSTLTLPSQVRHPFGYDASATQSNLTLSIVKKKIKKGKKKVTIGLFNTVLCPKNHKRQVALTFTLENGTSQTATREVACK